MIRVTQGAVGYKAGGKSVKLYTADDGEITLDPAAEARFVVKGVAVYVGEAPKQSEQEPTAQPQAISTAMKADELRQIGKNLGLIFKVGMSKADMVAELNELIEAEPEEETDGEAAPTFDDVESVR